MSVQFGRWSFAGECPTPEYVQKVSESLAPYGPDSKESYSQRGITILYRAFHTTKESRRERQPHVCPSGAVLTWDGRLDNREELIVELSGLATAYSTDLEIVAEAYERWGANCFAKLVGDWALAIWNPRLRSLILAKDPIGPRHLHYSCDDRQITWCTVLDPLVLFAGKAFKLCEEYIAGWMSLYPATCLTPYVGIHAVPPSSCVFLGPRKHIVAKYWDFDPSKRIRYRTDGEYEEHFRAVFANAVRRRLRSDAPILAELSGGRDSSSIVCMADQLLENGTGHNLRLDTVSWFDDSEPHWDDRPYFSKVEEKRQRTGWHIDLGSEVRNSTQPIESSQAGTCSFLPTMAYERRISPQFNTCLASGGYRVVFSGIGGDEVMGGVPLPIAELQDLLSSAQFALLAKQLKLWALEKRRPWFHLFWEAVRGFISTPLSVAKEWEPGAWLRPDFVKRYRDALRAYHSRVQLLGPLPSFQDNLNTLDGLRRQLAGANLPSAPPHQKRFPYLDRGLLEFMYAVPREQLLRPRQRRSLMRRALNGIVPDEILNRRKKAFVYRAPLMAISRDWDNLVEMSRSMVSASMGIVDSERFVATLKRTRCGEEALSRCLTRTIYLEQWLRRLYEVEAVHLEKQGNSSLSPKTDFAGRISFSKSLSEVRPT